MIELYGFWKLSTVNSISYWEVKLSSTGFETLRVLVAWSYMHVSDVLTVLRPTQVGFTLLIMCWGTWDLGFQNGNLTQIW